MVVFWLVVVSVGVWWYVVDCLCDGFCGVGDLCWCWCYGGFVMFLVVFLIFEV